MICTKRIFDVVLALIMCLSTHSFRVVDWISNKIDLTWADILLVGSCWAWKQNF